MGVRRRVCVSVHVAELIVLRDGRITVCLGQSCGSPVDGAGWNGIIGRTQLVDRHQHAHSIGYNPHHHNTPEPHPHCPCRNHTPTPHRPCASQLTGGGSAGHYRGGALKPHTPPVAMPDVQPRHDGECTYRVDDCRPPAALPYVGCVAGGQCGWGSGVLWWCGL